MLDITRWKGLSGLDLPPHQCLNTKKGCIIMKIHRIQPKQDTVNKNGKEMGGYHWPFMTCQDESTYVGTLTKKGDLESTAVMNPGLIRRRQPRHFPVKSGFELVKNVVQARNAKFPLQRSRK